MGLFSEDLTEAVNLTLTQLCSEFSSHPSYFFTENDLVCAFYKQFLNNAPSTNALDAEGKEHRLIHME